MRQIECIAQMDSSKFNSRNIRKRPRRNRGINAGRLPGRLGVPKVSPLPVIGWPLHSGYFRGFYFRGFSLSKPIKAHNFSTVQPVPFIVASEDSQLIEEDMSKTTKRRSCSLQYYYYLQHQEKWMLLGREYPVNGVTFLPLCDSYGCELMMNSVCDHCGVIWHDPRTLK